jgi:hypothetical protein
MNETLNLKKSKLEYKIKAKAVKKSWDIWCDKTDCCKDCHPAYICLGCTSWFNAEVCKKHKKLGIKL